MKWTQSARILGQGQLAWMLQMAGRKLGLNIQIGDDITSPIQSPVLTFESEFYKPSDIHKLIQNQEVFPSLKNLGLLQNRKTQKQSLVDSNLPTSPFWILKSPTDLTNLLASEKLIVAKKIFGGYDGYGTYVIKKHTDLVKFLDQFAGHLEDFIFERFVPFKRELALQVARSRSGDIQFFPLVESIQKNNKCFLVKGPIKLPSTLTRKIAQWLHSLDYVGVMGIEFFDTPQGLMINEIAPRVHNTGHHTLDSCTVDQFTMHWLCALQDKLPTIELKTKKFVMLNLIGKSHNTIQFPKQIDGQLYWYQKSNRPGRKLGHINFVGANEKALVKRALDHLKKWRL